MEIFLNSGPDERIMTAQRCGAWLAQFHNVAPRQGNLAEPDHLLPQTRYWTERIKSSGESFARRSESLSEKLEAAVPNSRTVEFCPGHGGYMPEHVFLNGKRTICFDLDEHDVADPARDLAWFIVSLQRLGLKRLGSLRARDIEVDAFLKSYATARDQNALRHLPFFKAAECLHRAHRDLYKRTPPIPQWAEIMIDEGLSALRVPSH